MEVTKIAGNGELERPALVGRGIAFAQTARPQRVALPFDFRCRHPMRELGLELAPILGSDRCGRDERQPLDLLRVLEEIEHGEQPAPGVAAQRQAVESELFTQLVQIGDMLSPPDRRVARGRRLTAAALIVVQQRAAVGEQVILRQQVVVTGAGTTVQHDNQRTAADATREQLHYSSTASASAISFTSECSRSPKPFGTSESTSIWPRIESPRRIRTTSSDLVNRLQAR